MSFLRNILSLPFVHHLSSYTICSIYDHSIFEAFSKVVQRTLIHVIPTLEYLLNSLTEVRDGYERADSLTGCLNFRALFQNCGMEKVFLFDIVSKIYIATDSNPVLH